MTALEAKEKCLWNGLPICIKNRIEDTIKYSGFYRQSYKAELYKSITPEAFIDLDNVILKLKGLGYEVEYLDGIDSKLIIKW